MYTLGNGAVLPDAVHDGTIISSSGRTPQIIPDTGEWVATRLGYVDYTNDLVYRPDVNLKFGAYYLAWARDYLNGNLISALVGYNAGPGNAERWRQSIGNDDALYVELLEYSEPRAYIRAILSNLYHYTRLYGSQ